MQNRLKEKFALQREVGKVVWQVFILMTLLFLYTATLNHTKKKQKKKTSPHTRTTETKNLLC
jgi:hypothetical protein